MAWHSVARQPWSRRRPFVARSSLGSVPAWQCSGAPPSARMGDPSPPCVCVAASWADAASCVCLRDRDSPSLSPVQLVRVPRTTADADGWAAGGHRGGQAGRGSAPAAAGSSLPLVVAAVFAAGAVVGSAVAHLPAVRRAIHAAVGPRRSHGGPRGAGAEALPSAAAEEQHPLPAPPPPVALPHLAAAPAAEAESPQTTPRAQHVGPRLSLASGSSPLDEATQQRILEDADRVVALKRAAERSAREQAAMGSGAPRVRRGSSSAAAAAVEWASQGGATPARAPPHLQSAARPTAGSPRGDAWRPWEPDAWDAVDLTVAFTPLRKAALGAADAMATPFTQRKGER